MNVEELVTQLANYTNDKKVWIGIRAEDGSQDYVEVVAVNPFFVITHVAEDENDDVAVEGVVLN